jgi:hypothetical protein
MSQRTTNETCPKCGSAALLTWSVVDAYGYSQPVKEYAEYLDCVNRCQFTMSELGGYFPSP